MALPLATLPTRGPRGVRGLTEIAPPLVLTARSLPRSRPDLAPALAAVHLELRTVASWDRLPEAAERVRPDVILIDMDAADKSSGQSGQSEQRHSLSGHRIVSLLARQCGTQAALVVLTRLDFAEIEDLARAGISDLLPPQMPAKALAARLCVAATRASARRSAAPAASYHQSPVHAVGAAPPAEVADVEAIWRTVCAVFAGQPASRSRISNQQVLAATLYLLRTGAPWSALPLALGSVRSVRRRLSQWRDSGALEGLRSMLAAGGITFPTQRWERLEAATHTRRLVAVAR